MEGATHITVGIQGIGKLFTDIYNTGEEKDHNPPGGCAPVAENLLFSPLRVPWTGIKLLIHGPLRDILD